MRSSYERNIISNATPCMLYQFSRSLTHHLEMKFQEACMMGIDQLKIYLKLSKLSEIRWHWKKKTMGLGKGKRS